MTNPRLEFALENIQSSDWRLFEKFASEFLIEDFPNLRTTASPSGDRGRDAEVFIVEAIPKTAFQYSVAADWSDKISDTITKITTNFPQVRRVVYCTNQQVGARADAKREQIWSDHGIQLDLRDRGWFIERELETTSRATASAELANTVIAPLLETRKIVSAIATPLSQNDSRVALLQLTLSSKDRDTNQSLTKTSFDALARAALLGSSADDTRSKQQIVQAVSQMLPDAGAQQIEALTSSALSRLCRKGGPAKHIRSTDRYHLSFEAAQAWQAGTAEYLLDQAELERDLSAALFGMDERLDSDLERLANEALGLRETMERLLLRQGEMFADAVSTGVPHSLSIADISDQIASFELDTCLRSTQCADAILAVLSAPSDRTRNHLTRVLDAYTLFAFLQQTPDVQKALSRLFDGGEIWLDTSATLPLIGELAMDEGEFKPYTALMAAARESGISFFVTAGVIEEINHHLENCLRYVQLGSSWRGRVPFIYSSYLLSGRPESGLAAWIADIKGTARPELDIAEFLEHWFQISRRDLADAAESADTALRGAVQDLWVRSHAKRRQEKGMAFGTFERLVKHDVENAVGVIEYRRRAMSSPLGYSAWWLTLDRNAFGLGSWLRDRLGNDAPDSPVLSPDFLAQMLRFGPMRRNRADGGVSTLPVSAEIRRFENAPPELLELARSTREMYSEYGELRIRREVRDAVDRARTATSRSSENLIAFDEDLLSAPPS